MKKIFLDTDVILDLLLEREPFFNETAILFREIENGKYEAYISALIVWNIYYIVEKYTSKKKAHQKVLQLRSIFKIIPIDDKIIDLALQSDFKDFEDSIQYFAAKRKNVQAIITRNKRDYKSSEIVVMNANEFINAK